MRGKVDMLTSLSNHTVGRQHAVLITAFSWTVLCGYHGNHKQNIPTTALVKQAKLVVTHSQARMFPYRAQSCLCTDSSLFGGELVRE